MKRIWIAFLTSWIVAGLGCGGGQEKGKNSAKDDRPKAVDKGD